MKAHTEPIGKEIDTQLEALKKSGFPLDIPEMFASTVFTFTKDPNYQGVSIAIRAGQPPNLDKGFAVSPKPMAMKTKTCNDAQGIPVLSGFIAEDQNKLGREHSKPIPKEGFTFVQLQTRLQDILLEEKKGNYEVWFDDNDHGDRVDPVF